MYKSQKQKQGHSLLSKMHKSQKQKQGHSLLLNSKTGTSVPLKKKKTDIYIYTQIYINIGIKKNKFMHFA